MNDLRFFGEEVSQGLLYRFRPIGRFESHPFQFILCEDESIVAFTIYCQGEFATTSFDFCSLPLFDIDQEVIDQCVKKLTDVGPIFWKAFGYGTFNIYVGKSNRNQYWTKIHSSPIHVTHDVHSNICKVWTGGD
jgi:hypothetical protein